MNLGWFNTTTFEINDFYLPKYKLNNHREIIRYHILNVCFKSAANVASHVKDSFPNTDLSFVGKRIAMNILLSILR